MPKPRPEEPGTKEPGPIVTPLGGSQSKSKHISPQAAINKKAMERYQRMLNEKARRRAATS